MNIPERLKAVQQRIANAAHEVGRNPDKIMLIAVSKTQPVSTMMKTWLAGQFHFGESYVQEAMQKQKAMSHFPVVWHFIGPLQSNKTARVANAFSWVHSVDRYKIAKRLSEQRNPKLPPLNICLQVNNDYEPTKHGVLPDQLPDLARSVIELPNLKLRGLMVIPKPATDLTRQRKQFREVHDLFDELTDFGLDTLSMGMSGDLEAAILEGTTMIRVGTALFGSRS